jgi:arabinogalactan oligomer / maltooligosaccharide transport system permease protein
MAIVNPPVPPVARPRLGRARGTSSGRPLQVSTQIILQITCLFLAFTVLYPILWVVAKSIDPSTLNRPTSLIPEGASLDAYRVVLTQPTTNPVSFARLALNTLLLAGGVTLFALVLAVSAAYAFSRFKFAGRPQLMIAVLGVLMLPAVAGIAPLFVLLNRIQVGGFNLRNSLLGVGLAMTSGALPFAIWNLKGYLDTIPKELEEAATIDGATRNQTFLLIVLPLCTPVLAVTAFLVFLGGWTEFALSWQFLTDPKNFTLSMALYNMVGQYAGQTPWSRFTAMALIIALPVAVVYLMLQKYIVGGLTVGSVKG